MDRATFEQLAMSHGAELSRWPEEVRNTAHQALDLHPEWRQLLEAEVQVDALLDTYALPKTDFSQLEQAILAKTVHRSNLVDHIINWLAPSKSIWRPAIAACLPILVGLSIGINFDVDEQYVLSEEIELLSDSYWSDERVGNDYDI